jgi:methionine-rich copper-binding protein CopC
MRKPVLLCLVLFAALARPVWGHAVLLEATPAANAVVTGPAVALRLRFNSRIDAARSRLTVLFPDRRIQTLTLEAQSSPDTLNSRASGLKSGVYKLQWQVLAADGHITRGEVSFEVK